MDSVDVLGVRIDDVTYPEALALLLEAIRHRTPHVVTTPNPEIVMLARRDAAFRAALNRAALNIPDGIGLVLAARLAGGCASTSRAPIWCCCWPPRPPVLEVGGSCWVVRTAPLSGRGAPWWISSLDSTSSAPSQARHWRRTIPSSASASPPRGPWTCSWWRTAPRNKNSGWIATFRALDIPVGIGVGGVFNYFSGATPRAPRWVRRVHFEWLHRLVTQPWRWRRQLALPVFGWLAVREAVRRRW